MTLISIEGVDGAGKTTQSKFLKEKFGDKAILEPEPWEKSDLGKWIRRELKSRRPGERLLDNRQLQTLFIANRVEHFQYLNPQIADGKVVIMDRGEISTATYGASSGDFTLEEVIETHRRADIPKPDLVLFLRLSDEEAERRRQVRKDGKERFDALDFQKKLAEIYNQLKDMNVYRWVDIDANKSIEEVHQQILRVLEECGLMPR